MFKGLGVIFMKSLKLATVLTLNLGFNYTCVYASIDDNISQGFKDIIGIRTKASESLEISFNALIARPIALHIHTGSFTLEVFLNTKKAQGRMYVNIEDLRYNILKAKKVFFEGARHGDYECMLELGKLFLKEGNFQEAIELGILSMQLYNDKQFLQTGYYKKYEEASNFITETKKILLRNRLNNKKILLEQIHCHLNDPKYNDIFYSMYDLLPRNFSTEEQRRRKSIFFFSSRFNNVTDNSFHEKTDLMLSNALKSAVNYFNRNQPSLKSALSQFDNLVFGIESLYNAMNKTSQEARENLLNYFLEPVLNDLDNPDFKSSQKQYFLFFKKMLHSMDVDELQKLMKKEDVILCNSEPPTVKRLTSFILERFLREKKYKLMHSFFHSFDTDPWFSVGSLFYKEFLLIIKENTFNEKFSKISEFLDSVIDCWKKSTSGKAYFQIGTMLQHSHEFLSPALKKEDPQLYFKKAFNCFINSSSLGELLDASTIIRHGWHGEKANPDQAFKIMFDIEISVRNNEKEFFNKLQESIFFNNLANFFHHKFIRDNNKIDLLKAVYYCKMSECEDFLKSLNAKHCLLGTITPKQDHTSFDTWISLLTYEKLFNSDFEGQIVSDFDCNFIQIDSLLQSRFNLLNNYKTPLEKNKVFKNNLKAFLFVIDKLNKSKEDISKIKGLGFAIIALLSSKEINIEKEQEEKFKFDFKTFLKNLDTYNYIKEEGSAFYDFYNGNLDNAYFRFTNLALASYTIGIKGINSVLKEFELMELNSLPVKKDVLFLQEIEPEDEKELKAEGSLKSLAEPKKKLTKKERKEKTQKETIKKKDKKNEKRNTKKQVQPTVFMKSSVSKLKDKRNHLKRYLAPDILFHTSQIELDYKEIKDSDKMKEIMEDILLGHWKTEGSGKPEILKYAFNGVYGCISRRFNLEDRIVYSPGLGKITFMSVKGHYK